MEFTLWRINHLRDIGTTDDVVKTVYMWVEKENDDFSEWCADGEIHAIPLCTVDTIDDIGDIAGASTEYYNDYFEPDAVPTSQGWRCDV